MVCCRTITYLILIVFKLWRVWMEERYLFSLSSVLNVESIVQLQSIIPCCHCVTSLMSLFGAQLLLLRKVKYCKYLCFHSCWDINKCCFAQFPDYQLPLFLQKRAGSDMHLPSLHAENDSDPPALEYCIDAGSIGNFARFINHSCEPNLFVQCVLSSHNDVKLAKVTLFAADTILPLQVSLFQLLMVSAVTAIYMFCPDQWPPLHCRSFHMIMAMSWTVLLGLMEILSSCLASVVHRTAGSDFIRSAPVCIYLEYEPL